MLFVPADSERKLAKGAGSGADALILDLEDSVEASRKPIARDTTAAFIRARAAAGAPQLYVRINSLDSGMALADLAAVTVPGLAGIVLPKADGAADVVRLGHYLDALEEKTGVPPRSVSIVTVATETPVAMLSMQTWATRPPRLAALTWGAEDLSAAVGAMSNREDDGAFSPLYVLARSYCLCAAAAAGVAALDTLHADFHDAAGLARSSRIARRHGFSGRLAIHPDQVPVINDAFAITEEERAKAQAVIDAFAANPGVGTIAIDGVMYDLPHLKQARRTLGFDT